jgi:two-component system chemotaxis response regulator CheB
MPFEHLIVIGASSGGIAVLMEVVGALSPEFPAPICVVQHVSAESPGTIHTILSHASALPAELASDERRLEPGRIYVAPADHHLLVEPGVLRVLRGPKENRFRPAIDPLFRSAAQVYGPRVIGVVLTGSLDDGTAGLWAIKRLGGIAIVQDPATAAFPSMPSNALEHVAVDYCVPAAEIGPLLNRLSQVSVHERQAFAERNEADRIETDISAGRDPEVAGVQRLGAPSPFACPECHGVLRQIVEDGRWRFRCHTGHAYSIESLREALGETVEETLWNAIRVLDEYGRLLLHIGEQHAEDAAGRSELMAGADVAFRDADTVRSVLLQRRTTKRDKEARAR